MDLKKFITQSLVEIMTGIEGAQMELKGKSHSRICPTLSSAITEGGNKSIIGLSVKKQAITLVEYDIAVEISTEAGGGGKIEVAAGIISAGGGADQKKADKIASRLQFSVPVAYPDISD